MAPKGTPAGDRRTASPPRLDKLLASLAIQKLFTDRGYVAMGGGTAAYNKYMDAEIPKWAKVVKASGTKVN